MLAEIWQIGTVRLLLILCEACPLECIVWTAFCVSESWQESPEFVKYLVELSSYGMQKLGQFNFFGGVIVNKPDHIVSK